MHRIWLYAPAFPLGNRHNRNRWPRGLLSWANPTNPLSFSIQWIVWRVTCSYILTSQGQTFPSSFPIPKKCIKEWNGILFWRQRGFPRYYINFRIPHLSYLFSFHSWTNLFWIASKRSWCLSLMNCWNYFSKNLFLQEQSPGHCRNTLWKVSSNKVNWW